jgi:hypothetical protein
MNKDKVISLARDIFLKTAITNTFLNDKNTQHAISTIENSIKIAELFYKVVNQPIKVDTPEDQL